MGCKDTVYIPLRGTKAVYSSGGIHLKYEADLKVSQPNTFGQGKDMWNLDDKDDYLKIHFFKLEEAFTYADPRPGQTDKEKRNESAWKQAAISQKIFQRWNGGLFVSL